MNILIVFSKLDTEMNQPVWNRLVRESRANAGQVRKGRVDVKSGLMITSGYGDKGGYG